MQSDDEIPSVAVLLLEFDPVANCEIVMVKRPLNAFDGAAFAREERERYGIKDDNSAVRSAAAIKASNKQRAVNDRFTGLVDPRAVLKYGSEGHRADSRLAYEEPSEE